MKKYITISFLSIFSLMVHGAENFLPKPKSIKRTSDSRKALAASDGAATQPTNKLSGNNLNRSLPVDVPTRQQQEEIFRCSPNTYSPNVYFGLGALLEKRNSYTPGNDSGR